MAVIGGKEAVRHFMSSKFDTIIPEDMMVLTPDIVVYTWVTAFNRPIPAGRPGEEYNYVAKMKLQAGTLTDCVHVLFYSRWNMNNETEMLDQIKHPNLIPMCLEDMSDIFPPESYNHHKFYNAVYFMDYMRQMVMYKASLFREKVRCKCTTNCARVMTGNAIMYVDMDIDFYSTPKEWLAPEGVLMYAQVSSYSFSVKLHNLSREFDTFTIEELNEAAKYLEGENCMVMVAYGSEQVFKNKVAYPSLKYNLLKRKTHMWMAFFQQASCISHAGHWTHFKWHSDMHNDGFGDDE